MSNVIDMNLESLGKQWEIKYLAFLRDCGHDYIYVFNVREPSVSRVTSQCPVMTFTSCPKR